MNPADAINPSVQAVSIHGTEWKHKKFSHVSPTTNFTKWSKALKIHLALLRLKSYVVSPLAQTPGKSDKPMANQNLMMNNNLAQAIILTALDESEYKGLDETKTAASLYKQVKTQVEGEGPVRMIALIQEILKIQCSLNESLTVTGKCISNIVKYIFSIYTLNKDIFNMSQSKLKYHVGLANARTKSPYTSDNIWKLLETKNHSSLTITILLELGAALPASLEDDHALDMKLPSAFCAHSGGAMEKQGIDTAQNAMCTAATAKGTGSTGGNAKVYTQLTGPKSNIYLMEEGDLKKLQMLSGGLSTASFGGLATNKIKWEGWLASVEEEEVMPAKLKTSIDWDQYSEDNNPTATPPPHSIRMLKMP
ncbi:hypothetical protein H2248_011512 [Termitomyces sp. 'cryptogamus']|nr:hypothetical protein H2248_011512 [Termitomyces sp. 'cryptogamus']